MRIQISADLHHPFMSCLVAVLLLSSCAGPGAHNRPSVRAFSIDGEGRTAVLIRDRPAPRELAAAVSRAKAQGLSRSDDKSSDCALPEPEGRSGDRDPDKAWQQASDRLVQVKYPEFLTACKAMQDKCKLDEGFCAKPEGMCFPPGPGSFNTWDCYALCAYPPNCYPRRK